MKTKKIFLSLFNSKLTLDEKVINFKKISLIQKKLFLLFYFGKDRKKFIKKIKRSKNKINNKKWDFNSKNIFEIRNFNLWYGKKQALIDLNFDIEKNKITSLIGPSGCGKSTFIRNLNRMNDLIEHVETTGDIWFNRLNLKSKKIPEIELRTKVGMVFQKAVPFDMSIYDNIAFACKIHGIKNKDKLDLIVENSLKDAALWDEVKDELNHSALSLSGGQQQRLCIARVIALEPEVLLMDEPTSALDPIATLKIEKLITKLSAKVTIIIVTHSMAQAQRLSDNTVFFYQGKVDEYGKTKKIFTNPKNKRTIDYINGKIG